MENLWVKHLYSAKRRCNDITHDHYKYYGGKGIKFYLTSKEGKVLWLRDKAYLMKNPSIDRKDINKDYTFDNCRFIELGKNVEERNIRVLSKPILQYDLKGNFIKEWPSQREASRVLNIFQSNIHSAIHSVKNVKQTHGFIFKLKV